MSMYECFYHLEISDYVCVREGGRHGGAQLPTPSTLPALPALLCFALHLPLFIRQRRARPARQGSECPLQPPPGEATKVKRKVPDYSGSQQKQKKVEKVRRPM